MRNVVVATIVLTSCVLLEAASRGPGATANDKVAAGQGSIQFSEDGVGSFVFDVDSAAVTGSLLFAAEDHHGYPDIVVRMSDIADVTVNRRTIRFSGEGKLHDEPVSVRASAFDGEGSAAPDRFSIKCTNAAGQVVLNARGDLFVGDVLVGEGED